MLFGGKKLSAGLYFGRRSYVFLALESSGGDLVVSDSASGNFKKSLGASLFSAAEADLSLAFEQVAKSVKNAKGAKVNFAVPMSDSLLRVVSMPGLTADEAKKAFRYEVESYFPFKTDECVFDLDEIDYPSNGAAERRFIVSAARRKAAEDICGAAQSRGLRFCAMEPEQTAIERAVSHFFPHGEGCLCIYAGDESLLILFVWHGNGIFYRNVAPSWDKSGENPEESDLLLAEEVRSSVRFGLSRNDGFSFSDIFLFGPRASHRLKSALCDSFPDKAVSVIFPERRFGAEFPAHDGWITALGLALRDYDSEA